MFAFVGKRTVGIATALTAVATLYLGAREAAAFGEIYPGTIVDLNFADTPNASCPTLREGPIGTTWTGDDSILAECAAGVVSVSFPPPFPTTNIPRIKVKAELILGINRKAQATGTLYKYVYVPQDPNGSQVVTAIISLSNVTYSGLLIADKAATSLPPAVASVQMVLQVVERDTKKVVASRTFLSEQVDGEFGAGLIETGPRRVLKGSASAEMLVPMEREKRYSVEVQAACLAEVPEPGVGPLVSCDMTAQLGNVIVSATDDPIASLVQKLPSQTYIDQIKVDITQAMTTNTTSINTKIDSNTASIITNNNSNTSTIVSNDNSNTAEIRTAITTSKNEVVVNANNSTLEIVNNDNSNKTEIVAALNAGTTTVTNNDNRNTAVIRSDLTALAAALDAQKRVTLHVIELNKAGDRYLLTASEDGVPIDFSLTGLEVSSARKNRPAMFKSALEDATVTRVGTGKTEILLGPSTRNAPVRLIQFAVKDSHGSDPSHFGNTILHRAAEANASSPQ